MTSPSATADLRRFASSLKVDDLEVRKVKVALDERQDGEPVTRIILLVNDPRRGESTWRFDAVRNLKRQLARKANEFDLPPASVTLVPESEAGLVNFSS